jgi:hypothetical protein
MDMYAYAADPSFDKLLSDNRDRYIQQSTNTRCGQVARLPQREGRDAWANRLEIPAEMCVWFSDAED